MASQKGADYGMFDLRTNEGQALRVMVSSGADEVPWEHVSVSTKTRCPTWKEMCWIKELFFEDEEVVIQYHPRKSDYVNQHPFCLHMWRPLNAELPLPPTIAVGPRTPEEVAITEAIYRDGHLKRGQPCEYALPGPSINGNEWIDDDRACVKCRRQPCGQVACEYCGAKQTAWFVEACGMCAKLIDGRQIGSTRVLSEHGVFCSMRCADAAEATAAAFLPT